MNNNKVQNPKTEVPATKEMNDSDMLNDLLETEKNMTNNYSIALNEASNEWLYDELIKLFKDTQDLQREMFELSFKKGWYVLEHAEEQKVTQEINKLTTKANELN